MGQQYGVDTSPLQFKHNSSFPGKVNADATIQGKNIEFAPGKDNEANIKHEVGHYIINTQRGTPPKADSTVNGQAVNTSDETAADKMMNTPLQRKESTGQTNIDQSSSQSSFSSQQPIQRITQKDKEIRNKANVGVEVELRNITITRNDRKWNESNGLEQLTTGGDDGQFVTDQHQGKSAIIEWASGHPGFSQTNKGKNQQDQVDEIVNIVNQNTTGKLSDLVQALSAHMDIGNLIGDHDEVRYKRNSASEMQTQVNVEVPFENIGKIPTGAKKDQDAANLFTGSASKKAKEVFVKSRKNARKIASKMLLTWNDNNVQQYGNAAKNSLASLLTIFLHSEINDATGGGKDAQGVLFKTGAGDLIRSALNNDGKKVLWYCIHEVADDEFINLLGDKAKAIYQEVYRGRGGQAALQRVEQQVIRQAGYSFKVGAADIEKDIRWEDEHTNQAYTDTVDEDWVEQDNTYMRENEVDKSRDYEWADTRALSGVKTGKTFGVSTHSSNDDTRSEKYLIAEIRRNDNDINKLVKMNGIHQAQRNKLAKKIRSLQTPIR